jgi:hypothetical protein
MQQTLTALDGYSPAARYGLAGPASTPDPANDTQLSVVRGSSVATANSQKLWHPDNPLFVLGVIAAVTFGLMAASTTVRVGKTTASASVGKTGK